MIRSTGELYEHFPWMTQYPNMSHYVIRFGMDDLIPIPWIAANIDSAEQIYAKCVKAGKTWRDYLDIHDEDKGVIL